MAAARLVHTTVHAAPQLAPAGPAVPLAEHPYFLSPLVNLAYPPAPDRCGHCQSAATVCQAFEYDEGQVDKYGRYELRCRDCGWFTLYVYAD